MADEHDQPQKRIWQSAAGLSAVAALITAVVSAGAFAVTTLGGDDAPTVGSGSTTPPSSPSASSVASPGADPNEGPAERVVYEDSLADRAVGWTRLSGPDCFSRFASTGFRLEVHARPSSFCTVQATFRPELVTLASVRIEVEAEWVRLSARGSERGRGMAGLRCRGEGSANTGRFYTAAISDSGWWTIDKWEGEQSTTEPVPSTSTQLAVGSHPLGGWGVGDTVHLELECVESEGGLVLAFSVDGEAVGAARDLDPLPPGDAGLMAFQVQGPVEVEFRELHVVEVEA